MPLFDSRFLHRLDFLTLQCHRWAHGQMMAQRATRQLGSGIEFADHREYSPGDDYRYLDWHAYARHGELLVKRFHEERDLRVDILLDVSRSMATGSPVTKFQLGQRCAAALAYVALAQLDRVVVSLFADQLLDASPELRGKSQVLRLLSYLEQQLPRGADTRLDQATQAMTRRGTRGGFLIVISDFLDPQGVARALDRLRYHEYEVSLLHLVAPEDAEPTECGDLELVDAETGEVRQVTIREEDLVRYRQAFAEHLTQVADYARAHRLGYIRTSTEVPCEDVILKIMRRAGWLTGS